MKFFTNTVLKRIFVIVVPILVSTAYAETLTLGSISSRPASEIRKFQPLVKYLSEALKPAGIDKVNLKIASSIDEMTRLILSGKVGIYMDSPFPSIKLASSGASEIVLRRWKKGVKEYHSVIFVRKDSGINDLEELQGKMIGFEEEFSTSSYFIPKASMQQLGMVLHEKSNRQANVSDNEVGYIFTDDDRNTVTWVRKGVIAAGAVNNIKFDNLKEKFKQQLKILYRSVSVPRQVVNFSIKLSPVLANAVKKALIDMNKTEKGKALLKEFEKTRKFDEFPTNVDVAMIPLKNLANAYK